jgi:hypothetical protein
MKMLAKIVLFLSLLIPVAAANAATSQEPAYNPCEHLAELYKQKSTTEYQGIVTACGSATQKTDVVSNAQNIAVVAKGVGEGLGEGAKGIGAAVGDLAKTLGVTVNDFLKTPAGTLLAFVLVVKYIGMKCLAIPFVMFMVSFWWMVNNRISRDVEYTYVPILWGAFQIKRVSKVVRSESDYVQVFNLLSAIGAGILCLIVTIAL